MLKNQICVGGHYTAKVNGKVVTVRVDDIKEGMFTSKKSARPVYYHVTNLSTGRTTVFRSAQKFREEVSQEQVRREHEQRTAHVDGLLKPNHEETVAEEGEQSADPSMASASTATPTSPGSASERGGSPPMNGTAAPPAGPASAPTSATASVSAPSAEPSGAGSEDSRRSDPPAVRGGATSPPATLRLKSSFVSSRAPAAPAAPLAPLGVHPPARPAAADKARDDAELDTASRFRQQGAKVAVDGGLASRIKPPSPSISVQAPHLEVTALAGTGKTTCAIGGVQFVRGMTPCVTPSPQQEAVWEQMRLGRSDIIRICAFNTTITEEVKKRLKETGLDQRKVEAKGIHSLGFGAVNKAFGYQEPHNFAVQDIIGEILGGSVKDLKKQPNMAVIITAAEELTGLCKQTLTEPDKDGLDRLTSHYDLELNGQRERVYELVPQVLERCLSPRGRIAFDDMIWLPLKLNLPIFRTDVVIGDESQDFNRMQQELIYRAGHRIVFIGDRRQAIYGFAGADAESMDRMRDTLAATPRGCVTLPLTVTRRCGKAIVAEARNIVKEYEAHESNPEGLVREMLYPTYKDGDGRMHERKWEDTYCAAVEPGDFLLCRCNAPLVSQCFRFLRRGIKANILGRKIGDGLVSLVGKSKQETVPGLVAWLSDWLAKETAVENAKKYPSDSRLIALQDKFDCLVAFTADCQTVTDVQDKIKAVFTDDNNSPGIKLSSIHKSKGLEARRVFLLQPEDAPCPHPMAKKAWEREQEWNLLYVAITRAKEELVYVS